MFLRLKKSGERSYVQMVENKRDGAAVRQRVIASVAPKNWSRRVPGVKLTDQVMLINARTRTLRRVVGRGQANWRAAAVRQDLRAARDRRRPDRLARGAGVRVPGRAGGVRRRAASTVRLRIRSRLHLVDDRIRHPRCRGLAPYHFYRAAMAWLGEESGEKPAEALVPRSVKGPIEERLFEHRRDLFADLSAVFMDTTSLSFHGEGGETLGEQAIPRTMARPKADDPRPHRRRRRPTDPRASTP